MTQPRLFWNIGLGSDPGFQIIELEIPQYTSDNVKLVSLVDEVVLPLQDCFSCFIFDN
jgi:hypothetical protein